jgi:hypothetical protein
MKHQKQYHLVSGIFLLICSDAAALGQSISTPAYGLLTSRLTANSSALYVYRDQDSGFNHGFPSGFFGNINTVHVDTGCIEDTSQPSGCAIPSSTQMDRTHGTVLRVTFDPQQSGSFAGVNVEEPENWGVLRTGIGYDLGGSSNLVFDARSPDGATVQFGVDGCVAPYMTVPSNWSTITIPLNSLGNCSSDFSQFASVHILFGIATKDFYAPHGGTVLLDNITFQPVPTSRQSALSFPLANQTFGVVPAQSTPVPMDQVLRNLTTIYESSLTELVLLARGTPQDLTNAHLLADTFDYALHHDSHGDALPLGTGGSLALHNGYESGDIALFNSQAFPKAGQAGDVRLAGFTATTLCPPTGFCLVLDGATGGNNAFAIIALTAAYNQFKDIRYLNDARSIGSWIISNLTDTTNTGYGGYYIGYPDMGVPPPKPLQTGKSVENNADIFAAFQSLAVVENEMGNAPAATTWTNAANIAGDFVMRMFRPSTGSFNVGTVPVGTPSQPGICPIGAQKGSDVINTCDFLDSNTFTTLALAGSSRYSSRIDWRLPVQYVLSAFASAVMAGGNTFVGFDLVPNPVSGPSGVAWEFTGQAVEAMKYVDQLYGSASFSSDITTYLNQLARAQLLAPFGDGKGLVASTLQNGDTLTPPAQCLNTPFQCIGERVGIGATAWGIIAEQGLNIFTVANPQLPMTISSNPGGISISVSGSGCSPGTYTTPVNLAWNPQTSCSVSFADPQTVGGVKYAFESSRVNGTAQSHTNPLAVNSGVSPLTINASYSAITGTTSATATHFQVMPVSNATSVGVPVEFTVTALDAVNNVAALYSDPVHFTSSDSPANLPGNVFLSNGRGTFSASLVTPGLQTITAIDLFSPAIAGTSSSISVSPPSGLRFVPVIPCRVVDTRNANGPFGGPFIGGNTSRSFAIPNSACGIPFTAQAYALNVTVVPHGSLGYLTISPTGQSRPMVSTLNSLDGRVKANAAIVPAGNAGAISAFATNDTDLVLDINGYFVPSNNPSGLAFYPMPPCRLVDTRINLLSNGPLAPATGRTLPIRSSTCNVPATAQAYSLNFTVVPPGAIGYLSVWPTGQSQPLVSTLNDPTGTVVANAAIVPAGNGGSIDVFATNTTDLVLDINGYFAPAGSGGLLLYKLPPCRVLDTRNPPGSAPFTGAIDVNVLGAVCGGTGAAQGYVFNSTVVPVGSLGYMTLWSHVNSQPTVSTLNALDGAITSNMAIVPTNDTEISAFAANPTHLILDLFGYFAP